MLEFDRLRLAIVQQAVIDYKSALKCRNFAQIAELERFFLGSWGQWLSGGNGKYIIEKCKQIVNKRRNV